MAAARTPATAPRCNAIAARPTFASSRRGFAVKGQLSPQGPSLLSIRFDSLVFGCLVAAIVHFVPQDAVFVGAVIWYWHAKSTTISPKRAQHDGEEAVEAFKAKKGIDEVRVKK